jgi:hypothetical protein
MATGTPHGTMAGAGDPHGSGDTPGLPPGRQGGGWTAGRVIAVVVGSVLALISLAVLGGGSTLLWADQAMRHDGYLTTETSTYSTAVAMNPDGSRGPDRARRRGCFRAVAVPAGD